MRNAAFLFTLLLACRPVARQAASPIQLSPLPPLSGAVTRFAATPLLSPRLADGGFIVTIPWGSPELPVRFDSQARYTGTIGRLGTGPGEYQGPQVVLATGDSTIVFDNRTRRATVLDGNRPVRTFPLPTLIYAAVRLGDGTFVVSQGVMRVGPSLFHLAADGSLLLAFGDSIGSLDDFPQRLLTLAPDGTFWSARQDRRCEINHWAAPGRVVSTMSPCGAWYPPYDHYRGPTPDEPPVTMIRGLWVDAHEQLWVVAQVADSGYRAGLGSPRAMEGQTVYSVTDPTRVWDGLIVVYARDGYELARLRSDTTFAEAPERGVVVQHTYDDEGWTHVYRYFASLRNPL